MKAVETLKLLFDVINYFELKGKLLFSIHNPTIEFNFDV